jgi:uncharacterized protein
MACINNESQLHLVTVCSSSIHGKGVFAADFIPKGSYIGCYEGPVAKRNGKYVLWVTDLDGTEYGISGQNKLRYLNHSSEPNTAFDGEHLYAECDIYTGDELTFHYGEQFACWLEQCEAVV